MKTIWKNQGPKKFVTREELPKLVRHAIAEMILGRTIPDEETPAPKVAGVEAGPELARGLAAARRIQPGSIAALKPKPEKTRRAKLPRAPGHVHKGRCGKRCFDGTRERGAI